MKRVIFFSHSQALGGAELSMLDIMERLDRSRFEPMLLAMGEGALSMKTFGLGAKVLRFPVPHRLAGWRRDADISLAVLSEAASSVVSLEASLRRLKPAVIYTHSQKAHVLGGLAGRLAGVPVVWHAREMLIRPGLRRLMSALSRYAPSAIISASEAVKRQFPAARGQLSVIPNGLDVLEIRRRAATVPRQEMRRRMCVPPGSPLVGMVSRIAPGKGQHVFIEAASRIAEDHPTARFLIVGGPLFGEEVYLQKLRHQAENLGLDNNVIFTGHLENPLPAMAQLDVLVHCPVVPEGFGRAVAEAMALGVPVAASRSGAVPELIEDGREGLLAEPGDAAGLARAVVRLLTEPGLGRRMAAEARMKIERCGQMENTVKAIERLLENI